MPLPQPAASADASNAVVKNKERMAGFPLATN
jgi:hypothetical protein